jgi:hypothetical protein
MEELNTKEKIEQITPEWIVEMMLDFKIKNPRQLSKFANVRYESLSLALNKKRNISSEIKNTLYFFFLFKASERKVQELINIKGVDSVCL